METKHGKVASYCEGLPPIKVNNPLKTWSRDVTGQIKIIFPYRNAYCHRTGPFAKGLREALTLKVA